MRRISTGIIASLLGVITASIEVTPSRALELTRADGSKNATISSAAVCTLLVRPSATAPLLPSQWRLLYTGFADPGAVTFLSGTGPAEAAPSCSVTGPTTDLERIANTTTVEFCGPEPGAGTAEAAYLIRLGPSARLRIAAVLSSGPNPGDSPEIGPGAEVTVNGGAEEAYPAAVWSAKAIPDSAGIVRAGIVGVGVGAVTSVIIQSSQPTGTAAHQEGVVDVGDTLQILSQSETALTVALPTLPSRDQTLVLQSGTSGALATASLSSPSATESAPDYTMRPPWPYRAKDFAFVFGNCAFHLFYIRHDQTVIGDSTEIDFGHAVSLDLQIWNEMPPVIPVRTGQFDENHVWAPTILKHDDAYCLYYTGVKSLPFNFGAGLAPWYQKIGVATSLNLMDWSRYDTPVYSGNQSTWAFADSSTYDGEQFRDPFVMPDPANADKWLMYHVAEPIGVRGQLIVGAARNDAGSTSAWTNVGPIWNTDAAHFQGWVESPLGFSHNGLYYLMYSRPNSSRNLDYITASDPVADSLDWSGHTNLYNETGAGPASLPWFAAEYLQIGSHEYLAVVRDAGDDNDGIVIREITWGTAPHFSGSSQIPVGRAPELTA